MTTTPPNDAWRDARGIWSDIDIPAEYLTGLAQGRLGEWVQEVVDAGAHVTFNRYGVTISMHGAAARNMWTTDNDGGDIERAFVRVYLAWRQREEQP